MNVRRVAFGGAGLLALVGALALGGEPAGKAVESLVSLLGNDYLVVSLFAGLGLLVAASAVASGRAETLEQTETPTPERPVTAPAAGNSVDETLASRTALLPVVGDERREELRERLRTAAVESAVRRGECPREEARERVETGTWTDDEAAAAFLADRDPGADVRLNALLRGEPWARRGARRAVAEIANEDETYEGTGSKRGATGDKHRATEEKYETTGDKYRTTEENGRDRGDEPRREAER